MVNMNGELELVITGMDCADCALTLQKSIERLDGVQACSVNFASGRMRVHGSVAVVAVSGTVTALGYGVAATGLGLNAASSIGDWETYKGLSKMMNPFGNLFHGIEKLIGSNMLSRIGTDLLSSAIWLNAETKHSIPRL